MMRAGLYRPVHVKTLRSQKLRMLLTHRQLLQSKAIAVENDLRDLIEPLARLVGSVPGVDPTVELQDLRLEHPELGAERGETRTRNLGPATTASSSSTPLRPTGASIPNSARWARIALITAVCWRMNRWRVRWSIRQLCCSGVLVATTEMDEIAVAAMFPHMKEKVA
jgi:hypothetical protein